MVVAVTLLICTDVCVSVAVDWSRVVVAVMLLICSVVKVAVAVAVDAVKRSVKVSRAPCLDQLAPFH